MAYVVYADGPRGADAQEAECEGEEFWPTVRLGTFGQAAAFAPRKRCSSCRMPRPAYRIGDPGPFGADGGTDDGALEAPLGVLGRGSVVLLAAGSSVIGPGGDPEMNRLVLQRPVRFEIGKTVAVKLVGRSDPAWTPESEDVAFGKDVVAKALDPVVAEPAVSPGSVFTANPGMDATIPAAAAFRIAAAASGSDARFAALAPSRPGAPDRRALNRIGTIVAAASAIAVVGLFAATLSLGGKPGGA